MVWTKQFLTKQWYEKLLREQKELKEKRLPEVLKRLKEASEQWDISENAEYDEALARRDLLEARIAEIERLVDNVEIIKKDDTSTWEKTVRYWSVVDLEFEDGSAFKVEIVGSWEVEIGDDLKISFQSPVGMAIRDKKVGDVWKVKLAGVRKTVTILSIA
jgi:transcription elongation factor GreA